MMDGRDRTRLALQALRAADQNNMGRVAGGMGAEATDRLADLDVCTRAYRVWSPALIPGLLQTDSYTAAAIRMRTPSLGMDEIERRTAHRHRREAAFLARRAGLQGTYAWFLIGEAAVTGPLVPHSHAEQLRHLLAIAQDYDNLVIQVLRRDLPQPAALEPFEIFQLDPGPVVGHVETVIGGFYTVASEDVARMHSTFSDLAAWAMTPSDTREYISEVLDTWTWDRTMEQSSSSQVTATRAPASTSPAPPPAPSE